MILLRTKSVGETQRLAEEVAAFARPGDLLVLSGGLGVGKTAFAQGFGRGLGVEEPITSPAFVLVRSYAGRVPMVHLDVYRLDHLQEIYDLGVGELLDDGGVTLVEWGDVVSPALPADFLEIQLEIGASDDERLVRIRAVGHGWPPRVEAVRRALGAWVVEG